MIAALQNTANKSFSTFFPENSVARGKPKLEPMTVEMGEVILKQLRTSADQLAGCLKEMQQLDLERIWMRLGPMNSIHMPYVVGFAEEAAGKVQRTHFAKLTGTKTIEEQQQEKYQRQSAAAKKTARRAKR